MYTWYKLGRNHLVRQAKKRRGHGADLEALRWKDGSAPYLDWENGGNSKGSISIFWGRIHVTWFSLMATYSHFDQFQVESPFLGKSFWSSGVRVHQGP